MSSIIAGTSSTFDVVIYVSSGTSAHVAHVVHVGLALNPNLDTLDIKEEVYLSRYSYSS